MNEVTIEYMGMGLYRVIFPHHFDILMFANDLFELKKSLEEWATLNTPTNKSNTT